MRLPPRSTSSWMPSVVARGVRFNVQRLGSGRPLLVLVHGLLFDNLSSWYFTVASRLARRHALLLYDLRGHGLSEQPPAGYTVSDMVDDLVAILDEEGETEPVVVVGNSFGGLVALAFARRHPARAAGLVLVDGQVADNEYGPEMGATLGLEGDERDRKIEEMYGDWLDRHRIDGALDRDASDFSHMVERTQTRRRRPSERVAERLVHETTLVADIESTPALSDVELREVRCPVLALYGAGSDILHQGRAVAEALPDCRLEIVPGAEHFLLLHRPDVLCERIEWFAGAQER